MNRTVRSLRLIPLGMVLTLAGAGLALAEVVDVLAISHDFASLPRTLISVSPVPQPSNGGGKLEIAESLGRIMTEELVAALERELPTARVAKLEDSPIQSDELVLESRFSKLVPGSRAKRFWLGFGAGKSVTEVSGEVRVRETGRVVARFTHARLSWCCGFGSNDHEIQTNLTSAASDIAAVVAGHPNEAQSYTWLDSEPGGPSHVQPPMTAVQKGVLQIDASTPHAEVLVDEGFMGTTPLELKLDPGSHRVIIKKHGFQDWTRDVQIVDGGKQALWADLEEVSPPKTQEDGEQHK